MGFHPETKAAFEAINLKLEPEAVAHNNSFSSDSGYLHRASIAISLKRIADLLEELVTRTR